VKNKKKESYSDHSGNKISFVSVSKSFESLKEFVFFVEQDTGNKFKKQTSITNFLIK